MLIGVKFYHWKRCKLIRLINWEAFNLKYKALKNKKEHNDEEKEFVKFMRRLKNIVLN